MRCAGHFAGIMCLAGVVSVRAAELTIQINDVRGAPVADAVVTLVPVQAGERPDKVAASSTKTIDQKDETFIPYIEIFQPGDKVVFRNSDRTRHHVYSFSPTKSFEFVLAPGESSAAQLLERTGVVAVGCNIHDQMITYLYISDAAWIARSGSNGRASLADVPPGSYDVHVWHPQLRPGRPEVSQPIAFAAASDSKHLSISLSLLPDPRLQLDHERSRY